MDQMPVASKEYQDVAGALAASAAVRKGLDFILADNDARIAEQIALTEIPAPPFAEEAKGKAVAERMRALGLEDVTIDATGNVIGRITGTDPEGPVLAVGAHQDTVFPAGTDCHVRFEDGIYKAPGISDDNAGIACLMSMVRGLKASGIRMRGTLIFVCPVGEEGNGDLRGTKAFFKSGVHVDGFFSVDSADVCRILHSSTGSRRFRVTFSAEGGHSWHKFGNPSANHALCRAVAMIADTQVPSDPRTSFTVGVIHGGTSVNAISAKAWLELDVRSNDNAEIGRTVDKILPLFEKGARMEEERWGKPGTVSVSLEQIGDRPAGSQPISSPVLQSAMAAQAALGIPLKKFASASTDQNVPLSLGIPATTLGAGGKEANNHALTETWDPKEAWLGPQLAFMAALTLLGVEGATPAMLPVIGK